MIVVDTNLVAYLLIEGPQTALCRGVFSKDPEWSAPLLWRSEFRNVLTTHMRHAGMTLDAALARMTQAEHLLEQREFVVRSDSILTLTAKQAVSAYDAEFVILAEKLGTQLVTTDKAVLKRFSHVATSPKTFVSAS